MLSSTKFLNDISSYEMIFSKRKCLGNEFSIQLGIIIEGINDYELFVKNLEEKISYKPKIIEIFNGLTFILFETELEYFSKVVKPELITFTVFFSKKI